MHFPTMLPFGGLGALIAATADDGFGGLGALIASGGGTTDEGLWTAAAAAEPPAA